MRPIPVSRAVLVALVMTFACGSVPAGLDAKRKTLESRVEGLALDGDRAALATSGGLVLMDVSAPATPRRLGALQLAGGSGAVAIHGDHALVACGAEGLVVADVSDPAAPAERGRLDTDGAALDVLPLDGERVLVADGAMGVRIVDLRDPAAPKLLATLETGGYPRSLAPHPAGALVAAGHAGLALLGIPEQGVPTVLGRLVTGDARAAVMSDDGATAFLADGAGGLVVVDLTRPEAPGETARFVLAPGEVHDVLLLEGSTVALAMGRGGLRVVEVRDERLREIAVLPMDRPAVGLAHAGRVLFVANDSGGLAAVDVSRTDRPRLLTPAPGP